MSMTLSTHQLGPAGGSRGCPPPCPRPRPAPGRGHCACVSPNQTSLLTIYYLQIYGRRKRSAAAQLLYAAHPYLALPALVVHPNGAVVPAEPLDVRQIVSTRA